MADKLIGKITHYFGNIGVAVLEMTKGKLKIGDRIKIVGGQNEFEQEVESMQVDKEPVVKAKKGQSVGLKVAGKVREGHEVYLLKK